MALSALLAASSLAAIVLLTWGVEVTDLQAKVPTPTTELAAVKIAYFIPFPSSTSTEIAAPVPPVAPTLASTATATRTRTPSPTRRPSATLTMTPPRTATPRVAMQAITRTATPAPPPKSIASPTLTTAPVVLNQNYVLLSVLGRPDNRPVNRHADLNLTLRGYAPASSPLVLVDYTGDTDSGAPQLAGLFSDNRTPAFSSVFRVYDWDWTCNCRGALLDDPAVTLAGIKTAPGEVLSVPAAGAQIGNGFSVLVIYVDSDQITVKYTRNDGAADGYALHIQGISVDSNLQALYRQADVAGRSNLPALAAGQAFARAKAGDVRIAIRDAGTFMDPRSRKDWWRGR